MTPSCIPPVPLAQESSLELNDKLLLWGSQGERYTGCTEFLGGNCQQAGEGTHLSGYSKSSGRTSRRHCSYLSGKSCCYTEKQ